MTQNKPASTLPGFGSGFGSGFSGLGAYGAYGGQQQASEEPEEIVNLNERMLLKELKGKAAKEFEEYNKTLMELASDHSKASKNDETAPGKIIAVKEDPMWQKNWEKLRKAEDIERVRGEMLSLAYKFDHEKSELEAYSKSYKLAKSTWDEMTASPDDTSIGSMHITEFTKRFIERVERSAEDFSQELEAREFRLSQQLESSNKSESEVIVDFVKKQYEAIEKIAANVAYMKGKLDHIRSRLRDKLRINTAQFDNMDDADDTCAQRLNKQWERADDEERKRIEKIAADGDLFGILKFSGPTAAASGFGGMKMGTSTFGSMPGFGSFGQKPAQGTQATTSTSTQQGK